MTHVEIRIFRAKIVGMAEADETGRADMAAVESPKNSGAGFELKPVLG
jgi:hypothetical protein